MNLCVRGHRATDCGDFCLFNFSESEAEVRTGVQAGHVGQMSQPWKPPEPERAS